MKTTAINDISEYSTETKKVLLYIFVLNILVLVIDIISGIATRSLGIIGGAVHSAFDAINNLVGFFVLRFAVEPPDDKHPYGHGKFETLSAFGIVIFLAIACLEIIKNSISRLIHPVNLPVYRKEIVWLLVLTLVINLIVWIYERYMGKKLKSDLLIADSSHTGSDILITISVILSQVFIAKGFLWVDPIVGIAIAIFVIKAGYEILTSTVPILVDEVWVDPKVVSESALSVSGVIECYDIYSRRSPYVSFIECKIKVAPKDLYGAHQLADKVEDKLKSDFGNCKVTVHVEP